jgi:hypothetical protein
LIYHNRVLNNVEKIEKVENEKKDKNKKDEDEKKKSSVLQILTKKTGMLNFTMNLLKTEGFLSLYDGITSSIFGNMVQYALYFCSSKLWSYILDHLNIKIGGIGRTMLINLIAALCTAVVTNPIWVVNVRMAKKTKDVKK